MSQAECAILREGVPFVKIYRYNPKHLCPKFLISNNSVIVINGRGDPLRWPRDSICPQKSALTSPTSPRAVGIVRLRTKATKFSLNDSVNNARC
jgi:hypothetical protein